MYHAPPRSTLVALAAGATLVLAACTVRTEDSSSSSRDTAATTQDAAPVSAPPPVASDAAPPASPPVASGAAPPASPYPDTAAPSPGDSAVRPPAAARDTLVDPTKVVPNERPKADMRIEVDVKARRLHVYRGQARVATHPVAVGTDRWPTRTGDWVISQVVWNPEWVPPRDESWTEDREAKAPGAPDNPLGRAQLIYDPPRTIHGTNRPASVGKAVSHGSIRMTNTAITRLAREVMEVAGVGEDEAWHRRVRENRGEKVIVDLPRVVPIRVQ